jgi:hypothetical protein
MSCCHEMFMIYIYIYVLFCRYTNHDYEIRTDRIYRLVIRECLMCYATKINHVSPKIFGSCFGCEDE